ncbi:hypothetical protein [Methylorubrum populi]|uniref:Uncharacterized protein n=1 Tax=Methylorubrum populi TaxID=223967 RepID=A0A833N108_9HYPH|nr:hypothetical protein [Methylorubrum populi]KAB7783915.1 hypothetical protein F8B43_3838 [Methylorubrum populi]
MPRHPSVFRPPSVFYAGRKVSSLLGYLEGVGHPISKEAARRAVALAWGWLSWEELVAEMGREGAPSPLDEDLVGPTARGGATARRDESVVGSRAGRAAWAVQAVTGLPFGMCAGLAGCIKFTGEPGRGKAPPEPAAGDGPHRRRFLRRCHDMHQGIWITPAEFRGELKRAGEPLPPEFLQFFADLRAAQEKTPSLPPNRPR